MKVKMAMYKSTKYNTVSPYRVDIVDDIPEYLRLSEIVEVDFIDLPKQEVNSKEIAVIRQAITNEMAESESRLNVLKQTLQERLAIGSDS